MKKIYKVVRKTHINAWTYVKDKIKFIANEFLWSEGHKDNAENVFSANMFAILYKGTFSYKFCSDIFDITLCDISYDIIFLSLYHFTWMKAVFFILIRKQLLKFFFICRYTNFIFIFKTWLYKLLMVKYDCNIIQNLILTQPYIEEM